MKKTATLILLLFSFFLSAQNTVTSAPENITAAGNLSLYREKIREMDLSLTNSLNRALEMIVDIKNQNPAAIARNLNVSREITEILRVYHNELAEISPPDEFKDSHEKLKSGLNSCIDLFSEITTVLELASSTDFGQRAVAQTKFQGLVGKFNDLRPSLEQYAAGFMEIMNRDIEETYARAETKPDEEPVAVVPETAPETTLENVAAAEVAAVTETAPEITPEGKAEEEPKVEVADITETTPEIAPEEKPEAEVVAVVETAPETIPEVEPATEVAAVVEATPETTPASSYYDPITREDVYAYENDYLFPSDTEPFPDEYLAACSRDELSLLRNEIYARRGMSFGKKELKEYFEKKSWYNPASGKVDRLLSLLEGQNVMRIVAQERKMGWR
ncbi:MAG: YARHG domain-containing protein [Fusobacteriaceae bacterium]|jgi:predicted small secreted protein|nr:YARHG domain-containing protein [Fusobacteriaceae bacterium]